VTASTNSKVSPLAATAPQAHYGSDANGLICGFRFVPAAAEEGGGDVEAIDTAAAQRWLAEASTQGRDGQPSFLWLHFNLSHAGAERWLREHADLDDNFFESLHEGSRSTRIERVVDSVFAVLNDVTYDFAFEASHLATLWISARAELVVTARRSPLRSVDRLRAAVTRGNLHLDSAAALLDHLLREQADELQVIARKASDRVDDLEDRLLVGRTDKLGAELAQLRRMSVRLQRMLAPEPSALFRMLANAPAWLQEPDRQRLRQASEEFGVVMRDIGALQERTKLLQEESAARVAEQNNRSLFTLTMVTVLALPINLISGLLGMNVGGVPFGGREQGFWIVVALIVGTTAAIARIATRRLGPRH
jgi:zinc transporter